MQLNQVKNMDYFSQNQNITDIKKSINIIYFLIVENSFDQIIHKIKVVFRE